MRSGSLMPDRVAGIVAARRTDFRPAPPGAPSVGARDMFTAHSEAGYRRRLEFRSLTRLCRHRRPDSGLLDAPAAHPAEPTQLLAGRMGTAPDPHRRA